jgi:YD repeat-containing protein
MKGGDTMKVREKEVCTTEYVYDSEGRVIKQTFTRTISDPTEA